MRGVSKLVELVAAALWDPGLDPLGLTSTLTAWAQALMALASLTCDASGPSWASWQSACSSGTWRNLRLCERGFLMPFLCHFWELVVRGVVFGPGRIWTKACGSQSLFEIFLMSTGPRASATYIPPPQTAEGAQLPGACSTWVQRSLHC